MRSARPLAAWANTREGDERHVRAWLTRAGLDGVFSWVITWTDAGARKPSMRFFDYALARCGWRARRCAVRRQPAEHGHCRRQSRPHPERPAGRRRLPERRRSPVRSDADLHDSEPLGSAGAGASGSVQDRLREHPHRPFPGVRRRGHRHDVRIRSCRPRDRGSSSSRRTRRASTTRPGSRRAGSTSGCRHGANSRRVSWANAADADAFAAVYCSDLTRAARTAETRLRRARHPDCARCAPARVRLWRADQASGGGHRGDARELHRPAVPRRRELRAVRHPRVGVARGRTARRIPAATSSSSDTARRSTRWSTCCAECRSTG